MRRDISRTAPPGAKQNAVPGARLFQGQVGPSGTPPQSSRTQVPSTCQPPAQATAAGPQPGSEQLAVAQHNFGQCEAWVSPDNLLPNAEEEKPHTYHISDMINDSGSPHPRRAGD